MFKKFRYYSDLILLLFIGMFIGLFVWGWHGMHADINTVNNAPSLSLPTLAYDLLRSNLRLLIGLVWSLIFAIVAGTWAAKSKHARRFILPFINFMESVPLVGFMTFSVILFHYLYPHSVMGLECAAIFGVFTGQAWNMALVFYQTLKIVPAELYDAANVFHMSRWSRFWKIEAPYSMPGLIWNTMVSQSAAWFALVGTEAIASASGKSVLLPGVGSYIQVALDHANFHAVIYSIIAMALNIILFDQIMFRPLVRWAEKFKYEKIKSNRVASSWLYSLSIKTVFLKAVFMKMGSALSTTSKRLSLKSVTAIFDWTMPRNLRRAIILAWYALFSFAVIYYGVKLINGTPDFDVGKILWMMTLTTLRVGAAMILSLIIFLPLGVWIGLSPKLTKFCQPATQILAALPPNILYPIMAVFLIATHGSLGWWTIPLIMIGTQWYVLFNVIAGTSSLPQEILDVSQVFSAKGWYYWKRIIIPSIFPYIVTGIISAAGGAWNADITAEIIQWGNKIVSTKGLGYYIANATNLNHIPQEALGCILMCALVALCVIFIWRPLYKLSETRYKIS